MTQTRVGQAPAPAPPPGAPAVNVVTTRDLSGAAVTAQDVATLKARRSELSDQLMSASGRRHDVSRQLQSATGANRAGLEQRLGVLDARIARLESDIDATGQQLASGPYTAVVQQEDHSAGSRIMYSAVPIIIVLTIFVLCPIAMAWSRAIWKRASIPKPAADRESAQRLARMEQAMEAIAIEVERVSEGQRFVTRLMTEGRAGAMAPVALAAGEKERV
ncbi:MAG: hypothetical protein ACRENC_19900 [Gemmatimonadaceae bacterium]